MYSKQYILSAGQSNPSFEQPGPEQRERENLESSLSSKETIGNIQLFRQSKVARGSVKAYATMPKGSLGNTQ